MVTLGLSIKLARIYTVIMSPSNFALSKWLLSENIVCKIFQSFEFILFPHHQDLKHSDLISKHPLHWILDLFFLFIGIKKVKFMYRESKEMLESAFNISTSIKVIHVNFH